VQRAADASCIPPIHAFTARSITLKNRVVVSPMAQ